MTVCGSWPTVGLYYLQAQTAVDLRLNVQECVLVYQDLILTLIYLDMLLISVMFHPIFLCLLHGETGSDRQEKGPNM